MQNKCNSVKRFLSRHKLILIIGMGLLLPVFIGMKNTEYQKWFEIYGDYASNILGIFIALIAVLYELDKRTTKLNREKRIELYDDLTKEIDNIKLKSTNLASRYIELYTLRDIEKYKKRYKLLAGPIYYIEKKNNEEEWNLELLEKRFNIFKEIHKLEKEIHYELNKFLNNRILFTPMDILEKEDLEYDKVLMEINEIEKYSKFLRNETLEKESNKYEIENKLLTKDFEDEENNKLLIELSEEINEKSAKKHRANKALDLVGLYLDYTRLYFQCDLIYIENSWKEDFLSDYKGKFDMISNREKNIAKILRGEK